MKKGLSTTTILNTFFGKFFWPLALVVIAVLISFANHSPDQWLTGWDTLHSEFNFPLHIYRSLFGVWREDQGLGTLAAHAHMSDLPRIIILWLMSIVVPLSSVRLGFVFLCFILAPLGIYSFLKYGIFKKHTISTNVAAFLGALVYIFNLGTLQHFYVIFEMFAVQYAALGWLFLFALKSLYEPKKKHWLLLFLLSFLSAPMAYASQLWFAYATGLVLFLFTILILEKKRVFLKRIFIIGSLVFAANAFWLLPNLYFLFSGASQIPIESHINRTFSPETFLHNAAYGKVKDVAILKNFLFNWRIYSQSEQKFIDLLPEWKKHLENPVVLGIGYATFIISLLGIIKALLKKNKSVVAVFPVFLLGLFMLMNANPPFDYLFALLRDNSSLFKEALRTPFTKFSILFMFAIAVYFGVFLEWFISLLSKFFKHKTLISMVVVLFISTALGFYSLPMFQGQLISKHLQSEIPSAYFKFYKWAETQPKQSRFALLPVNSFVGWDFHKWGYQGAGFLWFGMPQPLLVRDFDRWSPYNETFYNELSTAVYGNDSDQFVGVIKKYDVSFLILDQSIIEPNDTSENFLRINEIKEFLALHGIERVWTNEFIHVYNARPLTGREPFLYSPQTYAKVVSDTTYIRKDQVYNTYGSYISDGGSSIVYPFSDLLKSKVDGITYKEDRIILERKLDKVEGNYDLSIPPIATGLLYATQVNLTYKGNLLKVEFDPNPTVHVGNQTINLAQLPNVNIDTGGSFRKIYVNIGDRQMVVDNGGEEVLETSFEVNGPIEIEYFDADKVVESSGSSYVPLAHIHSVSLNNNVWGKLTKEQKHSIVSTPGKIILESESNSTSLDLTDRDSANNCDIDERGSISKTITDGRVVLASDNYGTVCDGITLANTGQKYSYLLRWQSNNVEGRPVKFYLRNLASDKNDLIELLADKKVDATYSIPSWPFLQGGGYYLSYENRSFGQPSSNTINGVQLYRMPIDLIASIHLEPQGYRGQTLNSVKLTNGYKFGTYQYGATVNNLNNSGVVVLSQAYDKGWIALKGSSLNFSLLEHTKYNGWANAWKMPKGQYDITIIYWPQLLSFIGFAILGTGLFLIIRMKKRQKLLKTVHAPAVRQSSQTANNYSPPISTPTESVVTPSNSHVIYDSGVNTDSPASTF